MRSRRSSRAVDQALGALPELLELLIISVRGGSTLRSALLGASASAPPSLRSTLDRVAMRVERGERIADALSSFVDDLGSQVAVFFDGLIAADRYGLPLGPVLDRLSVDIRAERRRRAELAARTLPVKLSFPLVVCTLPSFVLLAIVPAILGALASMRY